MSEKKKHLSLMHRLIEVMKEIKAINKESRKVNNQYTFVSHDSVAKALHDPLANNGIVMFPTIAELTQDGNRTSVRVDVTFFNADDPSDQLTSSWYGYGIDSQDKGIGKAISYAVKYCLLKTFCLETGDDVEKDNVNYKPDNGSLLTNEQIDQINRFSEEVKEIVRGRLQKAYKIADISQAKESQFSQIIRALQETEKDLKGAENGTTIK